MGYDIIADPLFIRPLTNLKRDRDGKILVRVFSQLPVLMTHLLFKLDESASLPFCSLTFSNVGNSFSATSFSLSFLTDSGG